MRDEALIKVINAIPQQSQRQYSADEQLQYLRTVANKLGLYDAAERLELGESLFMQKINSVWPRRR
jgi:phage gp36-like protein